VTQGKTPKAANKAIDNRKIRHAEKQSTTQPTKDKMMGKAARRGYGGGKAS